MTPRASSGFAGRDHFYRALLSEWLYCRETRRAADVTAAGRAMIAAGLDLIMPAGTRFRLFPQHPSLSSTREPETIWAVVAAGHDRPGAVGRADVHDPAARQAPLRRRARPVRPPYLYFPPWTGPVTAARPARSRRAISTICRPARRSSTRRTCSAACASPSTSGRAILAARSRGISRNARPTGDGAGARLRQRAGRLRLSRGRAVLARRSAGACRSS